MSTDPTPHLFWITNRAAGTAALILASVGVLLGLAMSNGLVRGRGLELRTAHEAVSLATLGLGPWVGFLSEISWMGGAIGTAGKGFYEIATKQQSAFAYGASIGGLKLGLILQTLVTATAALIVALVWRAHRALELRVAVLCCGTLLAAPYLFDYDLALLAVPIALVARRGMQDGFRAWEKSLLAALWLLPLIARAASTYHLPITLILLALSLAVFAAPALPWKTAGVMRIALPAEPARVSS